MSARLKIRHPFVANVYVTIMIITFLIGANVITTFAPSVGYVYYQTYITIAGLISIFLLRNTLKRDMLFSIMMVYMLVCMYMINRHIHTGIFQYTFELFGPPILAEVYYAKDKIYNAELSKAKKWLIYIYIFECGLAIIERILQYNFLQWSDDGSVMKEIVVDSEFRSFALLGHPLQNALTVSIIMSFVLISDFKPKKKYILWVLGFLAILSFNTRSSIVGNAAIFAVYLLYQSYKAKTGNNLLKLFGIAVVSVLGAFFMFKYTTWGGRLLSMGLFDSNSAEVRMDTWQIFDYFSLSNFLLPGSDREMILAQSGIWTTENFWIDWMIRYGLILIVPYLILMFMLIKKRYKGYSKFDVIITLATFLLIASTNNSLSASIVPLFIFISCIIFFSPLRYSYDS